MFTCETNKYGLFCCTHFSHLSPASASCSEDSWIFCEDSKAWQHVWGEKFLCEGCQWPVGLFYLSVLGILIQKIEFLLHLHSQQMKIPLRWCFHLQQEKHLFWICSRFLAHPLPRSHLGSLILEFAPSRQWEVTKAPLISGTDWTWPVFQWEKVDCLETPPGRRVGPSVGEEEQI